MFSRFSLFSIIPVFLMSMTAFPLSGDSSSTESKPVLKVWDFKFTDQRTNRALSRVDNLFREENPDLILEHKGFYDQQYMPSLRTSLLAGTGPDILWLHHGTEFSEFESYLEILDSYMVSSDISFRTDSIEACRTQDGLLKALPLTFQGMGWYYNKTLFKLAGLDPEKAPEDWDYFLDACRILKDHGITPIAAGNNRPLTTEFIRRSLITAFFTDEEIKTFYKQARGLRSPRFRLIIEFCNTLREKGYFHEEGLFRPYFSFAPDTFSAGEAAMIPGLLSDIAHWKNFSDDLGRSNVGYFPNLHHPDMARPGAQLLQEAGVLICMNKKSENKEAAFRYMEHLFSDRSQRILIEDLGILSPLENNSLDQDKYPVLNSIQEALRYTGEDPERYIPSSYVSDIQYRLDDLLINTQEITPDEYLIKIIDALKLY
ncbi:MULTISPECIES: ABC transporter substrate-binding protein [unclassified Oceanispirochaeta]|uniref:ABC transporter substrate-binding protein n=1 Tax=unclassified Oceanispirochaeta TaxID=2635722 RepID=UPI000E095F10|nr:MULTISPECIES: extracellular solute-binding protein [unclassified Oceanispirochaeta]MBF9017546.1 extracellular solute-binding protein [Oceanispirochaeta sp. M2]NPD74118.1 extracellular solute-binding protein [Oceanispirochaeta sp. M1]RDG30040.1 extracellular solute-binding protein [Oceanispirochaeta sp. M1]